MSADPAIAFDHQPDQGEALVHFSGRANRLAWGFYPQGGRLRLSLRDAYGSAPAIPATANVDWICREDEIVLKDAGVHRSLARAGVVHESATELSSAAGTLILARLTDDGLRHLPEDIRNAAW